MLEVLKEVLTPVFEIEGIDSPGIQLDAWVIVRISDEIIWFGIGNIIEVDLIFWGSWSSFDEVW